MKNQFYINGDEVIVFIKRNTGEKLQAIIDADELGKMDEYLGTWFSMKTGDSHYVYGEIWENGKRKRFSLHEFIMGKKDELYIDHINHNTLDNRKKNLRYATNKQNQQNRKGPAKNNKSGYLGVTFDNKNNKWRASIFIQRKRICGGYYDDVHEAGKVAANLRAKHFPYSKEAAKLA